jgi:hypothetical protein
MSHYNFYKNRDKAKIFSCTFATGTPQFQKSLTFANHNLVHRIVTSEISSLSLVVLTILDLT